MSAHFDVFEEIYDQASLDLKKHIVAVASRFFIEPEPDYSKLMPNDDDDALTALNKKEQVREVLMEHVANRKHDWNSLNGQMLAANNHGKVRDSFLVTSVILALEHHFKYMCAKPLDQGKAENADLIGRLKEKMAADSPENKDKWLGMIEVAEKTRESMDEAHAQNTARYEEWRSIAGERADMLRLLGGWDDCFYKDSKESKLYDVLQ